MNTAASPARWKVLLAFATIYLVWGSTFLAIRIGVKEVPPLVLAGMRFSIAGIVLYVWMRLTGTPSPRRKEWIGISVLSALIFVVDYGCVFWAEQRVTSGITAVVLATIPVFITVLDIAVLRTHRPTVRLAAALAVGVAGVLVLMNNSLSFGEAPIDRAGAAALLLASASWSVATILTRRLTLPASKPMSAAAQMLLGGSLLFVVAAAAGEFGKFHPGAVSAHAWLALSYLITAGSIAGFTAYLWLLHHESPTKVGTYAYVNPVVAIVLGHFWGGEAVGLRTLMGTLLVLVSVMTITTTPQPATRASTLECDRGMQSTEAD